MSRFRGALHAFAGDARAALAAAPVEVALGVLLAVSLSVTLREDGLSDDAFVRVAASAVLAFPLVFALSVLRARGVVSPATRWAGTAAVLAGAAAFGGAWMDVDASADGWRWFMLATAAVLLLVLAPALPWRERDRRTVWAFGARLVARIAGIAIYAGVLYALLAGAVVAVVSLFELRHPDHLYGDLAGAVFFALAPLILVGGIHRLIAPPEPGVPAAVALLGRWLYAPALIVYLVILYAYGLKVVATGELPRNLLSPLVIAAGLIGLVGGFLLHPVHGSPEHRGLSLLVRLVPAVLLPLVPLAVWALGARLGDYGWTEFRYLRLAVVVAIGVLAVLGTVRLARGGTPLLTTIPAVLATVLLVASVGPWSAPGVSKRDQTARLRAAFAEAGVDPRTLSADTARVDSAAYERIGGIARYLVQAHGPVALRAVVPAMPDTTRGVWEMGAMLGLRRECVPGERVYSTLDWSAGVPGVVGGTVWEVEAGTRRSRGPEGVRLRIAGERVVAEGDGWRAEGSLEPLAARLGADAVCGTPPMREDRRLRGEEALIELRDAAGTLRAQLVVTRIGVAGGAPAEVRGLLVVPPTGTPRT